MILNSIGNYIYIVYRSLLAQN